MKLYYAPDTCSLSPHIVLRELAIEFDLVKVDNRSKITADGRDFLTINETISTTVKALSYGKDKHSDYYDLNGYRKQGRPETRMKGINIIRQSDGTVKKRIILE